MVKWFILILVILVLIFLIIFNIIDQNEDNILFFPKKGGDWLPKQKYDEIFLNINDNKDVCYSPKDKKKGESYICCWHFNNFKGRPLWAFFHGTTGCLRNRDYIISLCEKFKFNLFLFDYSGYGDSCGKPSKNLLRENAETVHNYLHRVKGIPNKNIILWTESLGCLSAAYLCSKYEFGGLVLLSAFSSLDDVLVHHLDGYKQTGAKILTNVLACKMDYLPVKGYLYEVKCPVVIIHSKDDEIIPYRCARINYHAIQHKNKLFVEIKGGHSCPKITVKQLRKVFRFCDLPDDNVTSHTLGNMLKDLETYARRHNNFMD